MSNWFVRTCAVCVAVVTVGLMPAWPQDGPATSEKSPAPVQNPLESQINDLPSNFRLVPNAKDGNISSESLHPKIVESWITPSLEGSHFDAANAVSLGAVDTIDHLYTHEVQRVQWRAGDPIDLYIIKPVGVKNPPVILYLYSYPFETDRFLNHGFCKFLVRNGVAAVGFASALTGPRYHDRPMRQWFVSEMRESLATSAHDVQLILNYLADRGDFDMNRVGMFGDGSGASIAILATAADSRIKSLDLIDPWGDWPDWMAKSTRVPENERPNFLKQDWLEANAPMDPVKWLPQLKTPNVRLQFVKSVMITPTEAKARLEAAAPKQAHIIHYEDPAALRAAVADGRGLDWLKDHVRGESPKQYSAAGQARVNASDQYQTRQ
jgi:hypothetical protein